MNKKMVYNIFNFLAKGALIGKGSLLKLITSQNLSPISLPSYEAYFWLHTISPNAFPLRRDGGSLIQNFVHRLDWEQTILGPNDWTKSSTPLTTCCPSTLSINPLYIPPLESGKTTLLPPHTYLINLNPLRSPFILTPSNSICIVVHCPRPIDFSPKIPDLPTDAKNSPLN